MALRRPLRSRSSRTCCSSPSARRSRSYAHSLERGTSSIGKRERSSRAEVEPVVSFVLIEGTRLRDEEREDGRRTRAGRLVRRDRAAQRTAHASATVTATSAVDVAVITDRSGRTVEQLDADRAQDPLERWRSASARLAELIGARPEIPSSEFPVAEGSLKPLRGGVATNQPPGRTGQVEPGSDQATEASPRSARHLGEEVGLRLHAETGCRGQRVLAQGGLESEIDRRVTGVVGHEQR